MALTSKHMPKGETRTLKFQVKENGAVKSLTGLTPWFSVKEDVGDTTYKIGPIEGTVTDAANGLFEFDLTVTETDIDPFLGVFAIVLLNVAGDKLTLSPVSGMVFELYEDIYDVS